jgi:hypothetical protein
MSRPAIPFSADDISALARSLRAKLALCEHTPGHVELLNMLVRSTGHRNFQSYRAQLAARRRLEQAKPAPPVVDHVRVLKLTRYFDPQGRLASWPARTGLQQICLWVLWSKLPPRQTLTEDQLNRHIRANHAFGDHALLRRELCDQGLVARTPDGRQYSRIEREPSPEALALIHHLAGGRTE